MNDDIKKILSKYERKLGKATASDPFRYSATVTTKEYATFRKEILEHKVSYYEKLCNFSERLLRVSTKKKDMQKLQKSITLSHLAITPDGATSFAALFSLLIVFFGIVIGVVSYVLGNLLLFFSLFFILVGLLLIRPLSHLPHYFANKWRLEVTNQMVLCILYVVMYMRHTSNLEHGIRFAAEHVGGPLSLDLKKQVA